MLGQMADTARDPIDELTRSWRAARPDLDFAPMVLFARLNRFVLTSLKTLEAAQAMHELSLAEFDVLAALRRSGEPFMLRPSELADQLLLTRAGMTARVDGLVSRGLVERRRDAADRRSEPVALTKRGRALIDRAIVTHLQAEEALFAALSTAQHKSLGATLRRLTDQSDR
jgi:DNA-binding MarR family transcriptional regulator